VRTLAEKKVEIMEAKIKELKSMKDALLKLVISCRNREYASDCPSYKKTLDYLKEIINDESIDADLKLIRVDSTEDAQKVGFQGSPSIKINGEDIEGRKNGYSFTCRIYNIDGSLTGIPSKEYIQEKILKHKKSLDSIL
jgi:hypothetical protein